MYLDKYNTPPLDYYRLNAPQSIWIRFTTSHICTLHEYIQEVYA